MPPSTGLASGLSPAEFNTLVRTFHQFDKDGSNTIDVGELSSVMEHLGVSMDKAQLLELVEQVDVNSNGELEFDEFRQLITMWKDASKFKLFDSSGVKSLSKLRKEKALVTRLLLPDSWPRSVFDAVIALAACVYWIVVLLDDAWGSTSSYLPVEVVVTVLFVVDVAVCSLTCQLDGIQLVDDPKGTFRLYAVRWLVPDLLSALPWDALLAGSVQGRVLRHLRLLKVAKIPWLWSSSGRVPMSARHITFHFTVLPVSMLLLQFVLMCHGFAVGFMLLKQFNGTDRLLVRGADKQGYYPYDAALYYVIYTLCTIGYGDIAIDGPLEKWYACVVLFGTLLTNGFIIGKLVAIMQKADIEQDRAGKLRETLAVLEHFGIPPQLQDEVLQFQDHLLVNSLSASYATIVEGLPEEMQSNISLFVKLRLISRAPQFSMVHYIVRVAIAEALVNCVILPEQYVLVVGELATTMYFIAHGFVDTFGQGGHHLMTLKSGDFFGESALVEVRESRVSIKALTYCDLWGLNRTELVPLLSRFPRFKRAITELKKAQEAADALAAAANGGAGGESASAAGAPVAAGGGASDGKSGEAAANDDVASVDDAGPIDPFENRFGVRESDAEDNEDGANSTNEELQTLKGFVAWDANDGAGTATSVSAVAGSPVVGVQGPDDETTAIVGSTPVPPLGGGGKSASSAAPAESCGGGTAALEHTLNAPLSLVGTMSGASLSATALSKRRRSSKKEAGRRLSSMLNVPHLTSEEKLQIIVERLGVCVEKLKTLV